MGDAPSTSKWSTSWLPTKYGATYMCHISFGDIFKIIKSYNVKKKDKIWELKQSIALALRIFLC